MIVSVIGLGQMGLAMAARLLDAGHSVGVWNRTRGRGDELVARGARRAESPAGALGAEVVISMLADDDAMDAVWFAGGLVARLPAHAVHLNMVSNGLRMARRLADAHAESGRQYVAAPVFGRPPVAAQGGLDIVVAGEPAALARCEPVLAALGRRCFNAGREPHLATAVKIARNFLLAALVEGLGEALALVRKTGVDPAAFIEIITASSFDQRYRDYGRRMVERDFAPTFALNLGLKDVELAREAGTQCGVPLPTADLLREQHAAAIAVGFGEQDWAALGEFIAQQAAVRQDGGRGAR